jgi:hypothetical protein
MADWLKIHLTFITGLCVAVDPSLLALSCASFYVELQYLNIVVCRAIAVQ